MEAKVEANPFDKAFFQHTLKQIKGQDPTEQVNYFVRLILEQGAFIEKLQIRYKLPNDMTKWGKIFEHLIS